MCRPIMTAVRMLPPHPTNTSWHTRCMPQPVWAKQYIRLIYALVGVIYAPWLPRGRMLVLMLQPSCKTVRRTVRIRSVVDSCSEDFFDSIRNMFILYMVDGIWSRYRSSSLAILHRNNPIRFPSISLLRLGDLICAFTTHMLLLPRVDAQPKQFRP